MLINTEDVHLMEHYEELKEKLIEEKLEKGVYESNDIAIVRVTDHLPVNGIIYSLSNVPFVCKLNDLSHRVIFNELIKNVPEEKDYEKQLDITAEITKQTREYSPYSTQYRSSIHFTLNGLVSSHMFGNFSGLPFVIIELFKNHENDKNILSVRAEDTYFENQVEISKDAIILVDEQFKDLVSDEVNNNYKIIYYRGNQKEAVDCVLLDIGIVPELIGKDYAIESKTSKLLTSFIREKSYPQDKHYFSESYKKDDEKNLVLWKQYAINFHTYLYTKIYGDISMYEELINMLAEASSFDEYAISVLKNLITSIGLEKYKAIVDDYNNEIIIKIQNGEYPNNNQILSGASFGVSCIPNGVNR